MAKVITDDQYYHDIADAIRKKLKIKDTMLPSEMADHILAIPTHDPNLLYEMPEPFVYSADTPRLDTGITFTEEQFLPHSVAFEFELGNMSYGGYGHYNVFYWCGGTGDPKLIYGFMLSLKGNNFEVPAWTASTAGNTGGKGPALPDIQPSGTVIRHEIWLQDYPAGTSTSNQYYYEKIFINGELTYEGQFARAINNITMSNAHVYVGKPIDMYMATWPPLDGSTINSFKIYKINEKRPLS